MDPRIDTLANILVNYSVKVQPGNWVIVRGALEGMPLVKAVLARTLQAGGHPTVLLGSDELQEIRLRESSEEQVQWIAPIENTIYERADAIITVGATSNTRSLSSVDPEKQRLEQMARRPLWEQFLQRSAAGTLRWVVTQFPCPALAQEADMSLRDFEEFVYHATYADQPDAIERWQAIHDEQERLVQWLAGKDRIEVRGPNIDLSLSVAGRKFLNADGTKNMPDGEIFSGPVEDSVNGWVRFTYPAIRQGREVEGVEFTFENGRVIKATARKNQEYLISQLDSDPGARYLGEFAIGTNFNIQRFTKSILYDEKIGGTLHMAISTDYPETGSENQSSVHWDFICDLREDSEIRVDGELFYKNGAFQV